MLKLNRIKIIDVEPVGKPRMSQRDKWSKRPATTKYWNYKDQLVTAMAKEDFNPVKMSVQFFVSMPKSWSNKKKTEKGGRYHDQKPDLDNLCKAVMDCLMQDDSKVAIIHAAKFWDDGNGPRIILQWT